MFYVKEMLEDAEVKVDITSENVFTLCPVCGKELRVDLSDWLGTKDFNLYTSRVCCLKCSHRHQNNREAPTAQWQIGAQYESVIYRLLAREYANRRTQDGWGDQAQNEIGELITACANDGLSAHRHEVAELLLFNAAEYDDADLERIAETDPEYVEFVHALYKEADEQRKGA